MLVLVTHGKMENTKMLKLICRFCIYCAILFSINACTTIIHKDAKAEIKSSLLFYEGKFKFKDILNDRSASGIFEWQEYADNKWILDLKSPIYITIARITNKNIKASNTDVDSSIENNIILLRDLELFKHSPDLNADISGDIDIFSTIMHNIQDKKNLQEILSKHKWTINSYQKNDYNVQITIAKNAISLTFIINNN
jgi:hypothetical protein